MGERISVDIYQTSAIVLISASSIVILISFLGCCGAWKENRFLLFLYFVTLLILFLAVTIGATIAAFQSVDVIKEPLLKSMDNYDPNSQVPENLDITRAWDDVQREVWGLEKLISFFSSNERQVTMHTTPSEDNYDTTLALISNQRFYNCGQQPN